LYQQIRGVAISKVNIKSDWRKSGLYPVNIDESLSTRWVKDIIARESQAAIQLPPNPAPAPRVNAVLNERGMRVKIRDLERNLEAE